MKKRSTIFLSSLFIIIALSATGVYTIQNFLKPENLKSLLEQQFYNYTGRHILIKGDISWHLFPWLGLQLSHVEVGNPVAFDRLQKFAEIQQLGISLKLQPLLKGNYEVGNVYINGFKLNLLKNGKGETNWNFDQTKTSASANASVNKFQFHVKKLSIDDADIAYSDRQTNQNWHLWRFNFKAKDIAENNNFPVKTSFSLSHNNKAVMHLKAKAEMQMNLASQVFSISHLNLTTDDTRLSGNMNYAFQKIPQLTFDLSADKINTGFYKNLSSQISDKNSVQSSNDHINYSPLSFKGKFHLGLLQHDSITVKDLTINPQMQKGVFNITQMTAKLYQGNISGKMYANLTSPLPHWKITLSLNKVNLGDLLQSAQKNKSLQIKGILNLTTDLVAKGWQEKQLLPSINGYIHSTITQGEIKGLNLKKQLDLAKEATSNPSANQSTLQGVDQFSKLTGSMRIINGVGTTNDTSLESSITNITAQGSFNFINDSFDFKIQSKLAAQKNSRLASLQNYLGGSIPLRLTGDSNHYKIYPDAGKALKARAEEAIKKKLSTIFSGF